MSTWEELDDTSSDEEIKETYHELLFNSPILSKAYQNLRKNFKILSKDYKQLQGKHGEKIDNSSEISTQSCDQVKDNKALP